MNIEATTGFRKTQLWALAIAALTILGLMVFSDDDPETDLGPKTTEVIDELP